MIYSRTRKNIKEIKPIQTSQREKQETIEKAVDDIRQRYGMQTILRGSVMIDKTFSSINPHDDHTIHPVPFYSG